MGRGGRKYQRVYCGRDYKRKELLIWSNVPEMIGKGLKRELSTRERTGESIEGWRLVGEKA